MKRKKSSSALDNISSFFNGFRSNSANSQEPKTTGKIGDFQIEIASLFSQLYPHLGENIQTEWQAVKEIKGIYGPRVDIAVGPFSIERGVSLENEYDVLARESTQLLESLVTHHNDNVQQLLQADESFLDKISLLRSLSSLQWHNRNARCFLAIEIENEVSRKHLLGGAVNASALGRVGIVVGWTESKLNALVRLLAYWGFLRSVEKNTFQASNLLLLSRDQLHGAIVNALSKSEHQPHM